jgi:hypothetical protein
MNYNFAGTTVKALSVIAGTALLLSLNPSASYANTGVGKEITRSSEEQVTVQYIGKEENSFLFQVKFDNVSNQRFSVIVKNEAGTVIYHEQFTDAHFSKSFRLVNEGGEMRPTFVVRSGKQQVERSFEVNTKTIESVEVTKL